MKMDEAVTQALRRYMPRVQVKAGNGLSKAMNQTLRTYQQVPLIIVRTVSLLAGMETLFDFQGAVKLHYQDIYKTLMDMHDDWVKEVPRLGQRSEHQIYSERLIETIEAGQVPPYPEGKGTVTFTRMPMLPLHQFSAAWTIARRIGVIEGRGEFGLSRQLLADLRRLMQTIDKVARLGADSE